MTQASSVLSSWDCLSHQEGASTDHEWRSVMQRNLRGLHASFPTFRTGTFTALNHGCAGLRRARRRLGLWLRTKSASKCLLFLVSSVWVFSRAPADKGIAYPLAPTYPGRLRRDADVHLKNCFLTGSLRTTWCKLFFLSWNVYGNVCW